MEKFLLFICLLLFQSQSTVARSKGNLFKADIAEYELSMEGKREEEINRAVLKIVEKKADWCKVFVKKNPASNRGVFYYKKVLNVVGIGVSEYVSKARAAANKNCLRAMKENDISTVGAYSTYLKITTRNGYYIFVIRRKPSDSTFRKEDFNLNEDGGIDDIFSE